MSKHDWDLIKLEYICTKTSLRKLAEKHRVCKSKIFERCSKEHWVYLRHLRGAYVWSLARKNCESCYYDEEDEIWEDYLREEFYSYL